MICKRLVKYFGGSQGFVFWKYHKGAPIKFINNYIMLLYK